MEQRILFDSMRVYYKKGKSRFCLQRRIDRPHFFKGLWLWIAFLYIHFLNILGIVAKEM